MSDNSTGVCWSTDAEGLVTAQRNLATTDPPPWTMPSTPLTLGGCFICFGRGKAGPGHAGDPGWAGAALVTGGRVDTAVAHGVAGAPYVAGLLALREGPLLEAAIRRLRQLPEVLLVNATGRDHPRRAGLALHLGAVLQVPTVGVTHRPLAAAGDWPPPETGARAPLLLDGECVGYWLRTRAETRPLAVHAAWRTDPGTAVEVVLAALSSKRTPRPIAEARRVAREARAGATGTATSS